MDVFVLRLVVAASLTVLIECVIALFFVKGWKSICIVGLVNVATNVMLNAVFVPLLPPSVVSVFVLEIGVVLVEWLVYLKTQITDEPFMLSLIGNVVSFSIGVILGAVITGSAFW